MDYKDVYDNIQSGKYENKTTAESLIERLAQEKRVLSLFKQDLFEALGIQDNPKAELLFDKAWDMGHAYGLTEVLSYAQDLAELIS